MIEEKVARPAASKTASSTTKRPKKERAPDKTARVRRNSPVKDQALEKGKGEEDRSAKTKQRILAVATEEFSTKGYDGARVDEIVRRSKVSKNLVYHYFGSKEKLFIAVLESAYRNMHQHQSEWPNEAYSPAENIQYLVQRIFEHWEISPAFIGLLNSENFQKGRHIKKAKIIREGYENFLQSLHKILKEGEENGQFRPGVDPVEFYISISSLCYHIFSNKYTLSLLLNREYDSNDKLQIRLQHIKEMVLSYLMFGAPNTRSKAEET